MSNDKKENHFCQAYRFSDYFCRRYAFRMKDLEKSKEEELAENAEKIQNIISLIKKFACVLAMIAATFMFFYARSDYNNYSGRG